MGKQAHDIGHQKRMKREIFGQAKPRRPRRQNVTIPPELVDMLNLHSLEGDNHLQHSNQDW